MRTRCQGPADSKSRDQSLSGQYPSRGAFISWIVMPPRRRRNPDILPPSPLIRLLWPVWTPPSRGSSASPHTPPQSEASLRRPSNLLPRNSQEILDLSTCLPVWQFFLLSSDSRSLGTTEHVDPSTRIAQLPWTRTAADRRESVSGHRMLYVLLSPQYADSQRS